jgi:cell division septal protein FtsQ
MAERSFPITVQAELVEALPFFVLQRRKKDNPSTSSGQTVFLSNRRRNDGIEVRRRKARPADQRTVDIGYVEHFGGVHGLD